MASFPRDQFDDLPDGDGRIGAHRAPARRGRGWITFAWAVLATAVLVVAGLFVLSRVDSSFQLNLPSIGGAVGTLSPGASAPPTATPIANPSALPGDLAATFSVSILNGTSNDALDDKAAAQLKAAGWPKAVLADSSSHSVANTVVYYPDSRYEGAARGIAKVLGAGQVQLSDAFPGTSVTVLLGSDYKG